MFSGHSNLLVAPLYYGLSLVRLQSYCVVIIFLLVSLLPLGGCLPSLLFCFARYFVVWYHYELGFVSPIRIIHMSS